MKPSSISFKPKQHTKELLKPLKDRARFVVVNRFGLEGKGEKRTLESIGQEYGITRERVRQIENFAIKSIRKSDSFQEARAIFDEMKAVIDELGGVVAEEDLLAMLADDEIAQNHLHFYLVLGDHFEELRENKHFKKRWVTRREVADKVHAIMEDLYGNLSKQDLLTEEEIVERILQHEHMADHAEELADEDFARRVLGLSKTIQANPLNEWGRHDSPNVTTRGIKDYAYLVMRKNGSPLHFREVAEAIEKTFGKKAHVATCHNELIKDKRFVLVGRGLYALKQWGYQAGVVREVIQDILTKEGPLTKDEIIDRVLKERYLKRNTIMVNLQNPDYFRRDEDGRYHLLNS